LIAYEKTAALAIWNLFHSTICT